MTHTASSCLWRRADQEEDQRQHQEQAGEHAEEDRQVRAFVQKTLGLINKTLKPCDAEVGAGAGDSAVASGWPAAAGGLRRRRRGRRSGRFHGRFCGRSRGRHVLEEEDLIIIRLAFRIIDADDDRVWLRIARESRWIGQHVLLAELIECLPEHLGELARHRGPACTYRLFVRPDASDTRC